MCLGVPAQIVAIVDAERSLATADMGGVRREVNVACVLEPGEVPAACLGAWVIVHAGCAVARIDEEEARETLALLAELEEEEVAAAAPPPAAS
jgi:hydrogenase expression/formation protein HypC